MAISQRDALSPPSLPLSLLDGRRPHVVLEFDRPAEPYVRADPFGLDIAKHRGCMNVGPVLVGAGGGASHVPLPCFTHTCIRCGPERADAIAEDMRVHLASCESLWLCSFVAPDEVQLRRLLRTATRAVNRLGGNFLRVTLVRGGYFVGVLLADVDHSASPRGRPARVCDQLDGAETIAYLTYLLWHGIVRRRASKQWPLSDGERAHAGTSDRTKVGTLGMKNMPLLAERAREIYELDQLAARSRGQHLPDWSDHDPAPPDIERSTAISLWTRAHVEATAELRSRWQI